MKAFLISIFFAFLLFPNQKAFACGCPLLDLENWTPLVQKYINDSEVIFIGEVVETEEDGFSIKVIDVFKGDIKPNSVLSGGYHNCTIFFKGLNIFYGRIDNNNSLNYDQCGGLSRSLYNLSTTPPLAHSLATGEVDEGLMMRDERLRIRNWINEYALLNAYRNNHRQPEPVEPESKDYLSYFALAFSIIAVFIAFFKKQR